MQIFETIVKYCEKNDIKLIESGWLLYCHVLGMIGIIWSFFLESELFYKYYLAFLIWHSLTGLGITGGAHRLWAHKSYKASWPIRVFLMFMNSNCFQGSIWHWSRDHRLHHKFSDTPLDPHNSQLGLFFSHCGWLLKKKSKELVDEGMKLDLSDLKADSVVMFQKRHYYKMAFLWAFIIPTLTGLIISDKWFFSLLFLGFGKYIFTLNATWCVNSICHFYGSRKWNPRIEPRDNIFVSLITLGEGWHNWHHEYPRDWRASKNEWWMINPTCSFIQMCEYIGLVNTKRAKQEDKVKYDY
ncbi:unnamed protein product [Paramecium sonneborni]|uniref:Fatty acid desaturase domain-containing protein n=1 Tax=Paramecium sonneborni TaxID=65129 RepID=A0A8S1QZ53_9CILI|nr:unnamed protein product [Paramecium sonneborni]